ncbi:17591_t:CDS:2 [Racocetra persica]|uniref:17591_t:CDS:1 n=1 Tax=Racocetra persica TaxID=160502 RepID=A0ACA9LNB1_9GLOM|nr:17591_t:CDS:2 [Racocetra persica]
MGFLKYITFIFVLNYFFVLVTSAEPNAKDPNDDRDRYNVIIKSKSDCDKHYKWLKDNYNKTVIKSKQSILSIKNKNSVKDFSVDGFYGYTAWFTQEFASKTLKQRDEVTVVEKDFTMKINSVVPRRIENTVIQNINLDRLDKGSALDEKFEFPDTAGEGVNVFIVDTGIFKDHSDFGGRAKSGAFFCTNCENDDDKNGHGTNVAGIVAGKTFGVAKKSTVIAVRVFNATGSGVNSDIINGLTFVLDTHKKSKNKNSVVNMSLGGPKSDVLNKAVKALTDEGVHVVVAAGNDADDACKFSPSSEPTVITVGAVEVDPTDKKTSKIAFFSNFGKCTDIFAPGLGVLSAGVFSKFDLSVESGTSQATPHVAGTIALIIAKSGNQSPAKMATALKDLSFKNAVDFGGNKTKEKDTANNLVRIPAP